MNFTAKEIALVLRATCRLEDDYFNDDDTAAEVTKEVGSVTPQEWESLQRKLESLPRR